MAQCCYDEDVIFAYDVEDGAPLAAYFTNLFGTMTIVAGEGINGSKALYSPTFGEGTVPFEKLDKCGNPRREFAIGLMSKREGNDSYYLAAVGDSERIPEGIYSIYRGDPPNSYDLVIYAGNGATEVYRVANVWEVPDVVRKIEVRGAISTYNDSIGGSEADGWLDVRIDGRPYQNGDDYAAIDPRSEPPLCPKVVTGLETNHSQTGWDQVAFSGVSGYLDCLYIKETAEFCYESTILNRPGGSACPPPGPGGASFDGRAEGERTVQPGGFVGTYTPPTGGGVPTTGADPTDAQAWTDGATFTFDLTLPDASVKSYAQGEVVASGRRASEARVLRFSEVPYPLSDRNGNIRSQLWEVDLADHDGVIRGYLNDPTNRFFKKWEGHLYGESETARLAGTARRSAARGRVISVKTADQVVTLTLCDELTRQDSQFSLDKELAHVLIGDIFKAGTTHPEFVYEATTPQDVLGEAAQMIWGEASDGWKLNENPPQTPAGIVQVTDVGDFLLKNGSERWRGFLISLYALKDVGTDGVFGSSLHPECPSSVRLDPDLFSNGTLLIPDKGNWDDYFSTPYLDITVNGTTYRTMMLFARDQIADHHVNGIVPISVNVWGRETAGDCTGTLITDAAWIVYDLLNIPIVQRSTMGTEGQATFADGVPKINATSVAAVKAIHDARLPSTGYPFALILNSKRTAREWLADVLVSADIRICPANHHGQITFTTLNDALPLTNLTTFTDTLHVKEDSFEITSELSAELENAVTYEAGPEPATGRMSVASNTLKATSSITNWGETAKSDDLVFVGLYRPAVAADVAGRRLRTTEDGITRGSFVVDLSACTVKPGDVIRNTDYRGLGSSGWTYRVLLAETVVLNPHLSDPPEPDDLTYRMEWEDVHRLLVAPAGLQGGGQTSDGSTTSRIGFRPVGNTDGSPSDGWVVGNVSDGTAWRVA